MNFITITIISCLKYFVFDIRLSLIFSLISTNNSNSFQIIQATNDINENKIYKFQPHTDSVEKSLIVFLKMQNQNPP